MNYELLLYVLSLGWLGARLFMNLIEIVGSGMHDLRQTKLQRTMYKKLARSKRLSMRPVVSIVVYTQNSEETILPCLESIMRSSYRKFEVLVFDTGSTDKTLQIVRRFIKAHPKKQIKLITKKHSAAAQEKITPPLRSIHGDLILEFDAHYQLDRETLRNGVKYLVSHNDVDVLVPTIMFQPQRSLLSLLQQFDLLRTGVKRSVSIPELSPAMFRHKLQKRVGKAYDADDVPLVTKPLPSYNHYLRQEFLQQRQHLHATHARGSGSLKDFLNILLTIVVLLEPLMIVYFLYLALNLDRPEPLILTWVMSIFSLSFATWSNHQFSLRQKIKLIGLAPSMFIPMYVLTFCQTAAILNYILVKIREDWHKWQPTTFPA